MEVELLSTDFVKLFSMGKEIEYTGKTIVYDNNKIVFLFFYYKNIFRIYIVNGKKANENLVQIKNQKINKICIYENKIAWRFKKCIDEIEDKSILYDLCECFFIELKSFLYKQNYKLYFKRLLDKYKEL